MIFAGVVDGGQTLQIRLHVLRCATNLYSYACLITTDLLLCLTLLWSLHNHYHHAHRTFLANVEFWWRCEMMVWYLWSRRRILALNLIASRFTWSSTPNHFWQKYWHDYYLILYFYTLTKTKSLKVIYFYELYNVSWLCFAKFKVLYEIILNLSDWLERWLVQLAILVGAGPSLPPDGRPHVWPVLTTLSGNTVQHHRSLFSKILVAHLEACWLCHMHIDLDC